MVTGERHETLCEVTVWPSLQGLGWAGAAEARRKCHQYLGTTVVGKDVRKGGSWAVLGGVTMDTALLVSGQCRTMFR
jgi:hypothetical protein